MRRTIWLGFLAAILLVSAPQHGAACTADDFAAAVDKSGATLRAFNAQALPKLQDKLKQLKVKRGWDDADYEEKALDSVRDDRTAKLDAEAEDLILKIDTLGRPPAEGAPDCAKLAELEAAGIELLAVMKTKSTYTLSKLDAAIAGKGAPAEPKPSATVEGKAPAPQAALAPPPKPVPKAIAKNWATETQRSAAKDQDLPPVPPIEVLPPENPAEPGYTIDEMREITRGFFGTISTELASVLEYAFSTSGRPAGYVLGTEGGGAFLAGLRYGSGTLYLRAGGTDKVYWHGPSAGLDFGASGSRTMFLIYHLREPGDLLRTFTGVDGSAYFIGGVGITFLKGGPVLMAPIRTGLGFRLGANIGYIRFTPRSTWNPF
jgi:hypothetical protein